MLSPRQLLRLIGKAARAWSDDYAPSMGAAISYYTVFSLAPLLVIVIAIAGAVFGREAVQGEIAAQLGGLIGADGAALVQNLVAAASDTDKGLVAGLISGVMLLVGATTVFAELQNALDRIWHVPPSEKPKGFLRILRARLLSFGLILGLVFLLIVSLAVSTALAAFGAYTNTLMPGAEVLLQALNFAVSLGFVTVLFAMIFKLMPSTPIGWRDVWVGAAATAVLFEVGKFLIGLYLGKSSMRESFAAAGSMVLLIAWVYYAAQIFLLGAEFTKVYAQEHGSRRARRAMELTGETARIGQPAETAGEAPVPAPALAAAAAPAAAEAAGDPGVAPAAREQGAAVAAARLVETREQIRQADLPDALPRTQTVMTGVSALAGLLAVAAVNRMVHRKRRAAAQQGA